MLLNAYQEEAENLNLIEIASEFVCTEHRLSIFVLFKEQYIANELFKFCTQQTKLASYAHYNCDWLKL